MDDATYKQWWPLHIKHAQGEALTAEEAAIYEAGKDQLYADEKLEGNVEELKQLRAHVLEMEAELARMMEKYRDLKAKAESRETQLTEPIKHYIGVGG